MRESDERERNESIGEKKVMMEIREGEKKRMENKSKIEEEEK